MPSGTTWLRAALLCLAFGLQQAGAQQVRGEVHDSTTGTAVPGAVISLLDGAGHPTARTIADGEGRFHVPRSAAAVRLQVLRIGFHPRELRLPSAPSAGGDVTITVTIGRLPTLLEAVNVAGEHVCPRRPDRERALALWEQARTALLASVVARESNPATVELLMYDREVDLGTGRITVQHVHADSGTSSRPFLAAKQPVEFARRGYMTERVSGEENNRVYEAPDADVLLDESFASTHCFQIAKSDGQHERHLGLAFVPAPGRDTLVDVTGILWIDTMPPALLSMEFRYTGLEPAAAAAGAGGNLDFRSVPNGVLFIDRWNIRIPSMVLQPARDYPGAPLVIARRNNRSAKVAYIADAGGVVATAQWPDGFQWNAPLGAIRGQVVESDSRAPLMGVHVWLDGGAWRMKSDSAGRFELDHVLGGPYTLRAADSTLAAFGLTQQASQRLEVSDSSTSAATIVLPSRKAALARLCGEPLDEGRGVILGRVAEGEMAAPATPSYLIRWQDAGRGEFRGGHTGANGQFGVCNVPLAQPIHIRLGSRSGPATDTVVQVSQTMRVAAVLIGGAATPNGPADASALGTVAGTVRADSGSAQGVEDAEVAIPALNASARTNFFGEYRLPGLAPGRYALTVRADGFATSTDSIVVPRAGQGRHDVVLVKKRP